MSSRQSRAIDREFRASQRAFDTRERNYREEERRRREHGLYNVDDQIGPQNSPEAQRRLEQQEMFNRISGVTDIGYNISQHLHDAADRSRLNTTNKDFVIAKDDRDKICLPTGNIFRSNPDEFTGCEPFTRIDGHGKCCVQVDFRFLLKVGAVLKRAFYRGEAGRIGNEIDDWINIEKSIHVPDDMQVTIITSNADDIKVLDLATTVETFVTINIIINNADETLTSDVSQLRGNVHVRTNTNGATLSSQSLYHILELGPSPKPLRRLFVHCPLSEATVQSVVGLFEFILLTEGMYVEFCLPEAMDMRQVEEYLLQNPTFGTAWTSRPRRHDGPVWTRRGLTARVGYDFGRNCISIGTSDNSW